MTNNGQQYSKIYGPFKRDMNPGPNKNKIILGDWSYDHFRDLKDVPWTFTEKVDGTNIRVVWDGNRVSFQGKTDKANTPVDLLDSLAEIFPEEGFEQVFQDKPVTLYGEGLGPKIQGGGKYSKVPTFALFDVLIGGNFLLRADVLDVADKLGCGVVPLVAHNVDLGVGINLVRGGLTSHYGHFFAEGIVGVPAAGFRTRTGDRVIVKIKHVDLYDENLTPEILAEERNLW